MQCFLFFLLSAMKRVLESPRTHPAIFTEHAVHQFELASIELIYCLTYTEDDYKALLNHILHTRYYLAQDYKESSLRAWAGITNEILFHAFTVEIDLSYITGYRFPCILTIQCTHCDLFWRFFNYAPSDVRTVAPHLHRVVERCLAPNFRALPPEASFIPTL